MLIKKYKMVGIIEDNGYEYQKKPEINYKKCRSVEGAYRIVALVCAGLATVVMLPGQFQCCYQVPNRLAVRGRKH